MKVWSSSPIVAVVFILLSLTTSEVCASVVRFDFKDVGTNVDNGDHRERTGVWNLGKAASHDRTLVLEWDMYSVPDSLTLSWFSPDGAKTHRTGSISGKGSYQFTISAKAAQTFSITVNSGGGTSGTAWRYSLRQSDDGVIPLTLGPASLRLPELLSSNSSQKRSVEASLDWTRPTKLFGDLRSDDALVYKLDVPANVKALRIRTPAQCYITVQKGLIAAPSKALAKGAVALASRANFVSNTVIFCETTIMPSQGSYYITIYKNKTVPMVLAKVEIDCLLAGIWGDAKARSPQGEEETILVGIEGNFTLSNAGSSRLPLISHGRTDSPRGMNVLGNAAGLCWRLSASAAQYINWSEGSHANGARPLSGSRFIEGTGKAIKTLLENRGYSGRNIDYIGHSWGTYVGNELSIGIGRFVRFFALDPAQSKVPWLGSDLPTLYYKRARSINFQRLAGFSVSVHGNGLRGIAGLWGDMGLSQTASHRILVVSDDWRGPTELHTVPVAVTSSILTAVGSPSHSPMKSAFATTFGPLSSSAPWARGHFVEPYFHDVRMFLSNVGAVINTIQYQDRQMGILMTLQ